MIKRLFFVLFYAVWLIPLIIVFLFISLILVPIIGIKWIIVGHGDIDYAFDNKLCKWIVFLPYNLFNVD